MSLKFMGASVRGFTSSIGLGVGQQSQLNVQIVEDTLSNDVFVPPDILTPAYFQFGSFRFNGLYQKYEKITAIDGKNTYNVLLVDPREVLDCVQLILSSFVGPTSAVKNVFNVYGALEQGTGFGAAGLNEGGMPWVHILKFLKQVTNQPTYGLYGGPIHFRGFKYSLDLSQLPTMPLEYRISADFIGLTEMIAQVCEDGGCDFFVELDGLAIKIRTINRATQPPLGYITSLTNSGYGVDLIRSSSGLEGRNEVTSTFLIGGNVQTIYLTQNIVQYWGNDFGGNPIMGFNKDVDLYGVPLIADLINGGFNAGARQIVRTERNVEHMQLNAGPISNIIGDITYLSNVLEMRMAKISQSAWVNYIANQRPNIAAILGINNNIQVGQAAHLVGKKAEALANPGFNDVLSDLQIRLNAVYEFVKGYADEYYGRKFLATMPFTVLSRDDETLNINEYYSISDGGYLPENSAPLGLSPINEIIFTNNDGRFKAFAKMYVDKEDDISNLSSSNTVLEPFNRSNYELFTLAQVEPQLIFIDFSKPPKAIFTIDPVFEKQPTIAGDFELIAALLGTNNTDYIKELSKNAQAGNVDIRIAPPAKKPSAVAIPIKQNHISYGPWFANGAIGKVRVERDESLTPWNYGGYNQMNAAANAKVTSAITNTQVIETGTVELAGMPRVSLGDILQFGGPAVTNIDVNYSPNGITTSYRFSTFTNKFGVLNKSTTERMKRISLASQQLRRNIKASIGDINSSAQLLKEAKKTYRGYYDNLRKEVRKDGSPHEVIISKKFVDGSVSLSSCTIEEALTTTLGSGEVIASTASLITPYKIGGSGTDLPTLDLTFLNTPSRSGDTINASWLTQFGPTLGSGENIYFNQNEFDYIHNENGLRSPIQNEPKGVALRQPITLAGKGVDFHNKSYPSGDIKVGALECYWNDKRKLWSTNNVLFGTVISGSGSNYTTQVSYDNGNVNIDAKTVSSPSGVAFASGENVLLFAPLNKNDWYILNNSVRIPAFTTIEDICILPSSGGVFATTYSGTKKGNIFNAETQSYEEFCEPVEECTDIFCTPAACEDVPDRYLLTFPGITGDALCQLYAQGLVMNKNYNPNSSNCAPLACGWDGGITGIPVGNPNSQMGCFPNPGLDIMKIHLCRTEGTGILALQGDIEFPYERIAYYSGPAPSIGHENDPVILTKYDIPGFEPGECCDWPETALLTPL